MAEPVYLPLPLAEEIAAGLRCRDLEGLAPRVRTAVLVALSMCRSAGLDVELFETIRRPELQELYFWMGRTKARTSLMSWHGYGLAVDVRSREHGQNFPPEWIKAVAVIFKGEGMDWGGDWKGFRDEPHFQWGRCRAAPSDRARELMKAGGVEAVWREVGAT